ncbi:MAG TPA: DUF4133 domain-containing protein [Puia sp.]|nr:DUF4133 domain-containing protein [Puia sp.]
MTRSDYPIHRAIGRPLQFRGLQGQYILIAAAGLIADLFFFILLYCCHVLTWICVPLTLAAGAGILTACIACSRKYGVHGLQKLRARRLLPPRIECRRRRSSMP